MRREVINRLTEERTRIERRKSVAAEPTLVRHDDTMLVPRLHVLVRNPRQFEAVKEMVTGDIYTDDSKLYFDHKDTCSNLRLKTDKIAKTLVPYHNERLLVTDHGGVHAYRPDNDMILDSSLNTVNSYTLSYFMGIGCRRVTLSPELGAKEIGYLIRAYRKRNGQLPPIEVVAYGRHKLMAMQHCVIRHTLNQPDKCSMCKKERYFIEDIHGNRFPIVTDERCNNYIMDCKNTRLDIPGLLALGVRHFRLAFLDESAAETVEVTARFLDTISK